VYHHINLFVYIHTSIQLADLVRLDRKQQRRCIVAGRKNGGGQLPTLNFCLLENFMSENFCLQMQNLVLKYPIRYRGPN